MSPVVTQGTKTPPTLDGFHLTGVSTESFEIVEREVKSNVRAIDGSLREQRPYDGAGLPEVRVQRTFTLDYKHLGRLAGPVEARLAFAGPHDLCLWKHVTLGYRGDGLRSEFFLPVRWRLATHVLTPPEGLSPDRYDPEVLFGLDGEPLVAVHQEPFDYEAGSPPEGETWFARGETRLKVWRSLAVDELLVCRVVPVFKVFTGTADVTRRFGDPLREPRRIVLEEA